MSEVPLNAMHPHGGYASYGPRTKKVPPPLDPHTTCSLTVELDRQGGVLFQRGTRAHTLGLAVNGGRGQGQDTGERDVERS